MIQTIIDLERRDNFGEQGFYSEAYLANDKRLNRLVAVKDFHSVHLKPDVELESYFDEARRLAFASHPRVLPVYYVGMNHDDTNPPFPRIVTKYMKQGSLQGYLDSHIGRTPPLETLIRYAHDIIQGMAHLHALDIIHLDIKAPNILIGDDGRLVLADFGQSMMIKDEIAVAANELYPVLTPPEAFKKRVVDKNADIYQFGLLLYSMFNYKLYRSIVDDTYGVNTDYLKNLFKGEKSPSEADISAFREKMKVLRDDVKSGKLASGLKHYEYVPKEIQKIVSKCLEIEPSKRYNTFLEIQSDLSSISLTNNAVGLYQDIESGEIRFEKGGLPCRLIISKSGSNFNVHPIKNGTNYPSKALKDVRPGYFSSKLFTLVEEL